MTNKMHEAHISFYKVEGDTIKDLPVQNRGLTAPHMRTFEAHLPRVGEHIEFRTHDPVNRSESGGYQVIGRFEVVNVTHDITYQLSGSGTHGIRIQVKELESPRPVHSKP